MSNSKNRLIPILLLLFAGNANASQDSQRILKDFKKQDVDHDDFSRKIENIFENDITLKVLPNGSIENILQMVNQNPEAFLPEDIENQPKNYEREYDRSYRQGYEKDAYDKTYSKYDREYVREYSKVDYDRDYVRGYEKEAYNKNYRQHDRDGVAFNTVNDNIAEMNEIDEIMLKTIEKFSSKIS